MRPQLQAISAAIQALFSTVFSMPYGARKWLVQSSGMDAA
jgi:hypothetical protein